MFIGTPVTEEVANIVVAQLLYLDSDDPEKDISLYINSPGGSAYASLAIYDTMQCVQSDVQTICFGIAMSAGSMLLAGGAERKRLALPNSRILIHQPAAGSRASRLTSRSTPARSCSCASASSRCTPRTPGLERVRVHEDM